MYLMIFDLLSCWLWPTFMLTVTYFQRPYVLTDLSGSMTLTCFHTGLDLPSQVTWRSRSDDLDFWKVAVVHRLNFKKGWGSHVFMVLLLCYIFRHFLKISACFGDNLFLIKNTFGVVKFNTSDLRKARVGRKISRDSYYNPLVTFPIVYKDIHNSISEIMVGVSPPTCNAGG